MQNNLTLDEMYQKAIFKDFLFYKEDVEKNMERKYHPGEYKSFQLLIRYLL
jgi:hypothetical protein